MLPFGNFEIPRQSDCQVWLILSNICWMYVLTLSHDLACLVRLLPPSIYLCATSSFRLWPLCFGTQTTHLELLIEVHKCCNDQLNAFEALTDAIRVSALRCDLCCHRGKFFQSYPLSVRHRWSESTTLLTSRPKYTLGYLFLLCNDNQRDDQRINRNPLKELRLRWTYAAEPRSKNEPVQQRCWQAGRNIYW